MGRIFIPDPDDPDRLISVEQGSPAHQEALAQDLVERASNSLEDFGEPPPAGEPTSVDLLENLSLDQIGSLFGGEEADLGLVGLPANATADDLLVAPLLGMTTPASGGQVPSGGEVSVGPGVMDNLRRLAHLEVRPPGFAGEQSGGRAVRGFIERDVWDQVRGFGSEDLARIQMMLVEAGALREGSFVAGDWGATSRAAFADTLGFANQNGIVSWRVALAHQADLGAQNRARLEQIAREEFQPTPFVPDQLTQPSLESVMRDIDELVTLRGLSDAEQAELAQVWFAANEARFRQTELLRRQAEARQDEAAATGIEPEAPPPVTLIDPNEALARAIEERFQPERALIQEADEGAEQSRQALRSVGIFDRMLGT